MECGGLIFPGSHRSRTVVGAGLGGIALRRGAAARLIVLPGDLVGKLETDEGGIERRLRSRNGGEDDQSSSRGKRSRER